MKTMTKTQQIISGVSGVTSFFVSQALTKYLKEPFIVYAIFPTIFAIAGYFVIGKFDKEKSIPEFQRVAASTLLGQTLWMGLALFASPLSFFNLALDLVLMTTFFVLIVGMPKANIPLGIAIVLQLLATLYNVSQYSTSPLKSPIIIHIALRLIFIGYATAQVVVNLRAKREFERAVPFENKTD